MALLNVVELERESGVSKFTWRSWIRARRLPHIRLGRRVLVAEEDYRAFLVANRTPAAGNGTRATKAR